MASVLPDGFTIRPPTLDDIDLINQLITTCAIAEDGTAAFAETYQRSDCELPGFQRETDAWIVNAPDGHLAGYASIWARGAGRFRAESYIHPEQRGQGIETVLLQLSETRAQQLARSLPADLPATLLYKISSANTVAKQLLEQHGYTHLYHNWQMLVQLDEVPPPPVWPSGITVRSCLPGQDERRIYEVTTEAFADPMIFEEWAIVRLQPKKFQPDL